MRNLTTFILFLLAVTANARQISPDEAAAIASDFLNSSSLQIANARRIGVKRARAKSDTDGKFTSPYYVFNGEGNQGFVIISGDDRAKKILGYSDAGNFDFDNLPPALEWMLNQYENEINAIHTSTQCVIAENTISDTKAPIKPLLTTKWGQGVPYNKNCPQLEGQTTPTGCVATAIAQIMNYHQWPDKGEGSYSYDWLNEQTLSCNFETVSFDWDKYLDSYDDITDPSFSDNIAQFMSVCGIGLRTHYTLDVGSASYIVYAKRCLVENFKYDASAQILWKNHYYPKEWENILYKQLEFNQPVFITGGNHAFVCDGYDSTGFFHFNWGWDGAMDGYFQFTALSPNGEEFHTDLLALINIKKREGEIKPLTCDIICKGEFVYGDSYYDDILKLDNCHNYSVHPFIGKFGFEVEESDTGEKVFFEGNDMYIEAAESQPPYILITGREQSLFSTSIEGLADGKYYVYPAYCTSGNSVQRIRCVAGGQNRVCLEVSNNGENYIYTNPGADAKSNLEVLRLELIDEFGNPINKLYAHEPPVCVSYSIKNNSDIPAPNIKLIICDENGNEEFESKIYSIIEPNNEANNTFSFFGNLKPGKHKFSLKDNSNQIIYTAPEWFETVRRDYDMEVIDFSYEGDDESFAKFKLSIKNNSDESSVPFLHINYNRNFGEEIREEIQHWGQEAKSITTGYITIEKGFLQGNIEINIFDPYGNRLNKEPLFFTFPTYVISISFLYWGAEVVPGENYRLIPIIYPEKADNKELLWSCSDENIATVDKDGVVTGVSPGEATITATATDGSGVSASCKVTVRKPAKGDSNANGTVNIADAVNTANYAVGIEVENFCFEAADVNEDNRITLSDASGTVTILLESPVEEAVPAMFKVLDKSVADVRDGLVIDDYVAMADRSSSVFVSLDNTTDYVALQADVTVPEGMTLNTVKPGKRIGAGHSLMTRRVDERTMRIALFNPNNVPFANNDEPILELVVKGDNAHSGDIEIRNIIASDAKAGEYRLQSTGGHCLGTTAIGAGKGDGIGIGTGGKAIHIHNAQGQEIAIYSVDGRMVSRFTATSGHESRRVDAGLYIVAVGNETFTLIVK